MVRFELNGEPRKADDPPLVEEAVSMAGAGPGERGVAVAIDGEVVPRSEWESTRIGDGSKVEVLRAIQGG